MAAPPEARAKGLKGWAKDTLSRLTAGLIRDALRVLVVVSLPLPVVASVVLAWLGVLATPVPAYWIVVAFFTGTVLVLTAWAVKERPRLTRDERRLLVLLQHAGDNGAYYEPLQALIGLNSAKFNLLVHGLSTRRLLQSTWLDPGYFESGDPEDRGLFIRGEGKTLLLKLSPRALDDSGTLPTGVQVRKRQRHY